MSPTRCPTRTAFPTAALVLATALAGCGKEQQAPAERAGAAPAAATTTATTPAAATSTPAAASAAAPVAAPPLGKALTVDIRACPGTGALGPAKCTAAALSEGSMRLTLDSDLDGSGSGAPTARAGVEGKACDVSVAGGVVTLTAGDFKASAALDGGENDQVLGTPDAGMLTVDEPKAKLQISFEYGASRAVDAAQVNTGSRSVTCRRR